MNKIIHSIIWVLIVLSISNLSGQDNLNLKVDIQNYPDDSLFLGYYMGKGKFFYDTAISHDGRFTFEQDTAADQGVYILLNQKANHFLELILPEDQHFSIEMDSSFAIENMKIKGSKQNEEFYDYIRFLKDNSAKQRQYQGKSDEESVEALAKIDDAVRKRQNEISIKYKGTILGALIRNSIPVDVPEFKEAGDSATLLRYNYYKKHYFDNVDLTDDRYLRMPFGYKKISQYFDKVVPKLPDSIIAHLDKVLMPMYEAGARNTFRYYLSSFLNKYARSKVVGDDAIFVHLALNYYGKGMTDWLEQDQIDKIVEDARKMEPTLIGKTAPNVKLKKLEDNSPFDFYDLETSYKLLLFWDPDCGHCKKSMPDYVKFYEEFRERDLSFVAICTEVNSGARDTCLKYIKSKNGMDQFHNVYDPFLRSRYKQKYNVVSTPALYLLDKNNEIVLKNIPADKLGDIMTKFLQMQAEGSK